MTIIKLIITINLLVSVLTLFMLTLTLSRGLSTLVERGAKLKNKNIGLHNVLRAVFMSLIPIMNIVMLLYISNIYIFLTDDKMFEKLNINVDELIKKSQEEEVSA